MEVNPKPLVVKKLKEMAAKEGISLNALVVPYLNDLAAGKLAALATATKNRRSQGGQPRHEKALT